MKKTVFIGFDLGTTCLKAAACGMNGEIEALAKCEAPVKNKGKGRFEFDAEVFYGKVCQLSRKLAAMLPTPKYRIAGLSMASASGNTVLVGKDGKPLSPVISWLDKRMEGTLGLKFNKKLQAKVHEVSGWPFLETFTLAHLAWFREHMPDAFASAGKISMSTEYAAYRMTGKWGIDPSSATPFYLVDQKSGKHYKPYLDELGLASDKLMPVLPATTVLGGLTRKAARETGLTAGVPVVLGTFDHPACARGAGVIAPGKLLLSCGTSWVGFFPEKNRSRIINLNLLSDPFISAKGIWAGMFSLTEIGTHIERCTEHIAGRGSRKYRLFDAFAGAWSLNRGTDSAQRVPVLDWEKELKGKSREEAAWLVMQWAWLLMKEQVERLKKAGVTIHEVVMAGGPARSGAWPQAAADILGMPVKCLDGEYTGAVGAALTASVGAGFFKDEEAAWKDRSARSTVFQPSMPASRQAQKPFNRTEVDGNVYLTKLAGFLPEKLFDIHAHVWKSSFEKPGDFGRRGPAWPWLVAKNNSCEDLASSYRLLFPGKHVRAAVFGNPEKNIDQEMNNAYVGKEGRNHGFHPFLVCDPSWSPKELEKKIEEGRFEGLKPYLSFAPQHIAIGDIDIFDFMPRNHFEVADNLGLPVMLHIPRPGRLKDPVNLKCLMEIDRAYSKAKVIVAHVGRGYCTEDVGSAFKLLGKSRNLKFDFSANTNAEVMEMLIRTVGPKRILFGSDLPITRMRMKRTTKDGQYVNVVPSGLYGDVLGDRSMREVPANEAAKLTFFVYEEILAFKKAAQRAGLSGKDIEDVFHNNAVELLN